MRFLMVLMPPNSAPDLAPTIGLRRPPVRPPSKRAASRSQARGFPQICRDPGKLGFVVRDRTPERERTLPRSLRARVRPNPLFKDSRFLSQAAVVPTPRPRTRIPLHPEFASPESAMDLAMEPETTSAYATQTDSTSQLCWPKVAIVDLAGPARLPRFSLRPKPAIVIFPPVNAKEAQSERRRTTP